MESPWSLRLQHVFLERVEENLRVIKLKHGETTFGRYPKSDFFVPTKFMSRKQPHCRLRVIGPSLKLVACESMNPTFLNRRPVVADVEVEVKPGDEIGLGISQADNQDAFVYIVYKSLPVKTEDDSDDDEDDCIVIDSDTETKELFHIVSPSLLQYKKESPPSVSIPSACVNEPCGSGVSLSEKSSVLNGSESCVEVDQDEVGSEVTSDKQVESESKKDELERKLQKENTIHEDKLKIKTSYLNIASSSSSDEVLIDVPPKQKSPLLEVNTGDDSGEETKARKNNKGKSLKNKKVVVKTSTSKNVIPLKRSNGFQEKNEIVSDSSDDDDFESVKEQSKITKPLIKKKGKVPTQKTSSDSQGKKKIKSNSLSNDVKSVAEQQKTKITKSPAKSKTISKKNGSQEMKIITSDSSSDEFENDRVTSKTKIKPQVQTTGKIPARRTSSDLLHKNKIVSNSSSDELNLNIIKQRIKIKSPTKKSTSQVKNPFVKDISSDNSIDSDELTNTESSTVSSKEFKKKQREVKLTKKLLKRHNIIKKCTVNIRRVTPKEIKAAMYPKKKLKRIIRPSSSDEESSVPLNSASSVSPVTSSNTSNSASAVLVNKKKDSASDKSDPSLCHKKEKSTKQKISKSNLKPSTDTHTQNKKYNGGQEASTSSKETNKESKMAKKVDGAASSSATSSKDETTSKTAKKVESKEQKTVKQKLKQVEVSSDKKPESQTKETFFLEEIVKELENMPSTSGKSKKTFSESEKERKNCELKKSKEKQNGKKTEKARSEKRKSSDQSDKDYRKDKKKRVEVEHKEKRKDDKVKENQSDKRKSSESTESAKRQKLDDEIVKESPAISKEILSHPPNESIDKNFNPLDNYETVYIKTEPQDDIYLDYSQYTNDDDEITIIEEISKMSETTSSNSQDRNSLSASQIHSDAEDLPFDNELTWLASSQCEEAEVETTSENKEIDSIHDIISSDEEIFETIPTKTSSTPKLKKVIYDQIFGDEADNLQKEVTDEELEEVSDTSDIPSPPPPNKIDHQVSDISSDDSFNDFEESRKPNDFPQTENISSDDSVDSMKFSKRKGTENLTEEISSDDFEETTRFTEKKESSKTPQLIDALPLKPRQRGRPPHPTPPKPPRLDSTEKTSKEKTKISRISPSKFYQPKPQYNDDIRKLSGQKINKSNWIPGKRMDKDVKQSFKEMRKERLKQLTSKGTAAAAAEPQVKPSNNEPVEQPEALPESSSSNLDGLRIPVKVTTVNRGAFLVTDIKKVVRTSKTTVPVCEKIPLSTAKSIIVPVEKPKSVSKQVSRSDSSDLMVPRKKSVEKPESVSRHASRSDGSDLEVTSKKSVEKPKSVSRSDSSDLEVPSKKSAPSGSKKTASLKSVPSSSTESIQLPSATVKDSNAVPSSHRRVKSDRNGLEVPSTKTGTKETLQIKPRGSSNGKLTSILRKTSKYEQGFNGDKQHLRKLNFNDNLDFKVFELEPGRKLEKNSFDKSMTRHPLPDMKNSEVQGEMTRLIKCALNWKTYWFNVENSRGFPPPVWKKQYIFYLDKELKMPNPTEFHPPVDPAEEKMQRPPAVCGIAVHSYEAYHKDWFRLLLLELWANFIYSYNIIDDRSALSAQIVSCADEEGLKCTKLLKVVMPITNKELATMLFPNSGDFVILNIKMNGESKENEAQVLRRTFGYVEGYRTEEATGRALKMHPISGKPVIATHVYDVLIKYQEWNLENCEVTITPLPAVRNGLKSMQGVFELASSPLKDIILHPDLKHLTAPPPVEKLSAAHIVEVQRFLGPLIRINEEQIHVVRQLTETLMCGKESLSIIEGSPGTGKTRILVATIISLLMKQMNSPSSCKRGRRILVCTTSYDALNSLVHTLTFVRKHIRENLKNSAFEMVVVGSYERLGEQAKGCSLQILAAKGMRRKESSADFMDVESMMEQDENILMASINNKKLQLEYARSKSRLDAKELERSLYNAEELLRQLRLGMDTSKSNVLQQIRQERMNCEVLRTPQIILTTLNGLTSSTVCNAFGPSKFAQTPICMIDDAHRAAEFQCLMPLMCGANKLVLAGDLKLPSVVLRSKFASDLGLRNSLMLRVSRMLRTELSQAAPGQESQMLAGKTYYKLRQQCRMSPQLTMLFNQCFHADMVIPKTLQKDRSGWPLRPFTCFDHDFPKAFNQPYNQALTQDQRHMWLNREAEMAAFVLREVQRATPTDSWNTMVLVPNIEYRERFRTIHNSMPRHHKSPTFHLSLDQCSGIEACLVILCLGDQSRSDGEFHDIKQVALALSRAKTSLIIIGHVDYVKVRREPRESESNLLWQDVFKFSERQQATMTVHDYSDMLPLSEHMFRDESGEQVGEMNPPPIWHSTMLPGVASSSNYSESSQLEIDVNFDKCSRFLNH